MTTKYRIDINYYDDLNKGCGSVRKKGHNYFDTLVQAVRFAATNVKANYGTSGSHWITEVSIDETTFEIVEKDIYYYNSYRNEYENVEEEDD